MADWLFDRTGQPTLILDGDVIRSKDGVVIGWVNATNVYSLRGGHIGWYEGGVIYDAQNCAIGFTLTATGPLPSRPGTAGSPGMPGFAGRPGRPGLAAAPGRPGRGGWSTRTLATFFD